ncbi:SDR family NAD(P)-dependent oxidoreductase [Leptolyngbya sp. AN03gr2]|uniref:SDR family NAD(P)-dependent oxidoreductase n=1 Tax=unclassified Leptolyngbya TaxID=2650499 RepID=UPI003D31E639
MSDRPFAVVTGASSGIGYELAKQFAEHGFDLLVTDIDSKIDEAAPAFEFFGAKVQTVQADLAEYEGVEKLIQAIKATGQPLEAIAINAGFGEGGKFTQTDLQKELKMIDLNISSSVHLAKFATQVMEQRRKGRILFTSSIAALMPGPFEAVYAATKTFLRSFSQALREEMKDFGVTVTALMPGPTDTNFFHAAEMDDTRAASSKKDDPAQVAKQGFEALMSGKDEVVAGSFMNKVQAAVIQAMPEPIKAAAHRQLSEPGSGSN